MISRKKLWPFLLTLGLLVPARMASAQATVSLTFDDGLLSATTAQQILDAHAMKGTFYIISGLIGTDPNFYLGLGPIQALQTDGHEIGGHTVSHPDMVPTGGSEMTPAQEQHEICDGRSQLIGMGFSPVTSFAYPYGDASATTESIAKACGFTSGRGAWNSNPVQFGDASDTELLPPGGPQDPGWIRTPQAVDNTTTLAQLQGYVQEAENVAGGNGWVVLQFHFICADTDPSCGQGGGLVEQYGIGVSTFTAFITWLQSQPVLVKTVGQVMGGAITPIPAITTLTPSTMTVNGSSQILTVTGVNFVNGSVVNWNGSALATTFLSATSLSSVVPATDLASVQITTITVTNPGGAISPGRLLPLINPVPVLSTLSSTFSIVGSPAFTLTATGSNFIPGSSVRWNGSPRATTFVSSTSLTAQILVGDLTTVKIDSVTVFNAAPGGGGSSTQTFTVLNPVPVLTTLSSTFTIVGNLGFTLTLTGSNFNAGDIVQWNGSARTTHFVSPTQITADIPTSDFASVTIANVNVFNPAFGGWTSANKTFTVGNPVPVTTALSSTSTLVGGTAFSLTVTGSNFVATSTVQWNGSARTTHFVNNTTLTADIPASDLAISILVNVTVLNPAPGGGTSNGQTFTVGNPGPGLASLSPNFALVGSTSNVTMTVTGLNFVPGNSIVQWNGSARVTTFVNINTLTALVLAGDLTSVGNATVTVNTTGLGGGISNALPFTIGYPVPVTTALSSTFTIVGSSSFSFTVTGSNFVASSIVQWNGSARTTHFGSATTLTVDIPASDLTLAGLANVTVFNPAPGGGTSNAQAYTVINPVPVLTGIDHPFITAGGPSFSLTATGIFPAGSVLQWNGSPLTTISASSTTLSATVPTSDFLVAGNASVTAFTPAPGGGMSQPFQVVISSAQGGGASVIVSPRVYPNPWRVNLHVGKLITFDQLPNNSTVKIFTASAHWVATLSAPAGSATWDLKNDSGDDVASGYYIYLITGSGAKTRGVLGIIR